MTYSWDFVVLVNLDVNRARDGNFTLFCRTSICCHGWFDFKSICGFLLKLDREDAQASGLP